MNFVHIHTLTRDRCTTYKRKYIGRSQLRPMQY